MSGVRCGPAPGVSPGVGVHACAVMRHSVWERACPCPRYVAQRTRRLHALQGGWALRGAPARPIRSGSGGRADACPRSRDRGGGGGAASEVVWAPRASGLREPERGRGVPVRAGHWGEMPQRTGWLGKRRVRFGRSQPDSPAHRRAAQPGPSGLRRAPAVELGSSRLICEPAVEPGLIQWAKPAPRHPIQPLAGQEHSRGRGCAPALRPDRLGVTGRREQEHRIPFRVWGSSHAERVVLRRYGGRLAASGTTRLRPDRYSWKAEGEARGHLRTDTLYNAPTARMFRPPKVIWIATNRVTAW